MAPATPAPSKRVSDAQRTDRVLARESRAARPHFAAAAGLGVAMAVAVVAQAALLAHVIAAAAVGHASLRSLRASVIALAGVFCIRALLSGAFELSGRLGAGRVMVELRHRLASRILVDSPGRAPNEQTGELAAAAVQGVDSLETYFAGYLPALMMAVVVPIAIIIWVFHADMICAVILWVTIPVLITFMILIGLGANSLTRQRWQTLALLSSHFLDVVSGLETLRAHRRERAQADTLATVGERYRLETMATLRLAFLSALVLEGCAMLGTALVAATIGVQLTSGHLKLEAGLSVLLLAPELYAPLRAVGQQFHASADGLAAAALVLSAATSPGISGAPPAAAGLAGSVVPDPRWQPLHFTDVSFSHPGRPDPVLVSLHFTLAPGVMTALTGPSGAGKSTLAALTLGLAAPSAGTVSCGGVDLRQIPAARWQRRCAWVPQRATLFSATLAENIALSCPDADTAAITAAADQAGLAALLNALPDGLDTWVGDGGRRLSAGQGQRVALARAFLTDASLVVLDEPTANLDAETAAAIADAIVALAQDRTVLVITHDADLAERASVIVTLSHSQVAVLAGQEAMGA
jgi:thiol reductant ABC exporter CydD subunit